MKPRKRLSFLPMLLSAASFTFMVAAMSGLAVLLGGDARVRGHEQPVRTAVNRKVPVAGLRGWLRRRRMWLRRRQVWLVQQGAAALMNVVIAGTVAVAWAVLWLLPGATPPGLDWPTLALKGFALWCLAFLPCWLYVRFLGQRAGALWDEYVLNLHRLGWDQPRFLPRPLPTSQFYDEWADDGGLDQDQDRNIYRQKFNAYYGRSVSDTARGENFRVSLDTLFPVFLAAGVLAVGWTAVLWDDRFLRNPADVWDVLKFGFLGAYVFIAQMLLRRFFASDLRPSAYASALLRIIVVLVSVAAVYQVLGLVGDPNIHRWEAVSAFTIGFIPVVATQVLLRAASAPLRAPTRVLASDYPLSQLDGLNIWYEDRLAEENIDDMQNLATANFVDIILHTRVPVGRLVDWVDQAFLFLHLDRVERGLLENRRARKLPQPGSRGDALPNPVTPEPVSHHARPVAGSSIGPASRSGTRTRTQLRQLGIRTATDLIKAFPPEEIDPDANSSQNPAPGTDLGKTLEDADMCHSQIRNLVRVLSPDAPR